MAGDYSRFRFDPTKNFSAVLNQMGKVQLDSDWNELAGILDREFRTTNLDTFGKSSVPKETPTGFEITFKDGQLMIGPGRIYVDGLQVENHGIQQKEISPDTTVDFDPILGEQRNPKPTPFNRQPYRPRLSKDEEPKAGQPHLVYIEAWQREVTHLQEELVEKAIGFATTTRWQTVWQVKTLNVSPTTTCGSRLEEWEKIIRRSTARLSTKTVDVPMEDDPCLLPPSGGYRGLENRLYRVEWHDGGFKWSRDNASIAASVTEIDGDKITLGRELVDQFERGDWIEITDDWREFSGKPGHMARIRNPIVDSVLDLESPIVGGDFKPDDPSRHTRVIRWNQHGRVFDTQGKLLVDLNDPNSKGVIPIPSSGVSVVLEHGVQVTLIGSPHPGDYWVFAARTADGSVEILDNAPPKGIHRHYCRLAIATIPTDPTATASISDCRTLWPPDVKGGDCECTICVSEESHKGRTLTIQMAIDKVIDFGGGTICLGAGTYELGEDPRTALRIEKARSIKLRGQGAITHLRYHGKGAALRIDHSSNVTVEGLEITARGGDQISPVVGLSNSLAIKIEGNILVRLDSRSDAPAIGLSGILIGVSISDNSLFAPVGVGNAFEQVQARGFEAPPRPSPVAMLSFHVEHNAIFGAKRGIGLIGTSLHFLETRLVRNFIYDCAEGGIVATGYAFPEANIEVHANKILARGSGIIVGTDGTRIWENEINPVTQEAGDNGIALRDGINLEGMDRCMVFGNRIKDMGGDGIAITAKIKSAMIKNNIIRSVGGGGIVMDDKSTAEHITVENNQLFKITSKRGDRKTPVTAIRVINASHVQVQNNTIDGLGQLVQNQIRAGIQLVACGSARVMGNDIVDIGAIRNLNNTAAGVDCWGPFGNLEIGNNTIRRSREDHVSDDGSNWMGISVSSNDNIRGGPNLIFTSKNALVFLQTHIIALPIQLQSRQQASTDIHNNTIDAYGRIPVIKVVVEGACTLSNNTVRFRGKPDTLVDIRAAQLIASANDLWGSGTVPALWCHVPDPEPPLKPPFSILGNITSGPIVVSGADLGTPWDILNVRTQ